MILFLTEYFKSSGLGHLRRCMAFAELFEDLGYSAKILVNTDDPYANIFDSKFVIRNWLENLNLEDQYECIVIDSYHALKLHYEKFLKFTARLVAIDDNTRIDYPNGCIIYNGGLGGLLYNYDTSKYKKVLVGPEFALVRRQFHLHKDKKIIGEQIRKVLISMGGSDPLNLTLRLIRIYASKFPNFKLDIIIGPGFENFPTDEFFNSDIIRFYKNLDADSMYRLMCESDLCITAGGQTVYELGKLGVPFIVIKTAENQLGNLLGLNRTGLVEQYIDPIGSDFEQKVESFTDNLSTKNARSLMNEKLVKVFNTDQSVIVRSVLN